MFARLSIVALLYLASFPRTRCILDGREVHVHISHIFRYGLVHIGAKEGREYVLCNGVLISYRYVTIYCNNIYNLCVSLQPGICKFEQVGANFLCYSSLFPNIATFLQLLFACITQMICLFM